MRRLGISLFGLLVFLLCHFLATASLLWVAKGSQESTHFWGYVLWASLTTTSLISLCQWGAMNLFLGRKPKVLRIVIFILLPPVLLYVVLGFIDGWHDSLSIFGFLPFLIINMIGYGFVVGLRNIIDKYANE